MSEIQLIYDTVLRVDRETVRMRLNRCEGGFVFEREAVEKDGATITQTLPFVWLDSLNEFLLVDPYCDNIIGGTIKEAIQLICDFNKLIEKGAIRNAFPVIDSLADAITAISTIRKCDNELHLDNLLDSLFNLIGVESYLFVTLQREGRRQSDVARSVKYRFLIGCHPALSQLYNHRRWFAIDPSITYTLSNGAPVPFSTFVLESQGQRDLLDTLVNYGFLSSLVIPAHGANSSLVGMLLVGNNTSPAEGEPKLQAVQPLLRAIATELLEWQQAKLNAKELVRVSLSQIDLELLKLEREGFTSEEAARELGITVSQVNNKFRRINKQLSVSNKKDAVSRLVDLGVL